MCNVLGNAVSSSLETTLQSIKFDLGKKMPADVVHTVWLV
jgi:hypothetical protein